MPVNIKDYHDAALQAKERRLQREAEKQKRLEIAARWTAIESASAQLEGWDVVNGQIVRVVDAHDQISFQSDEEARLHVKSLAKGSSLHQRAMIASMTDEARQAVLANIARMMENHRQIKELLGKVARMFR